MISITTFIVSMEKDRTDMSVVFLVLQDGCSLSPPLICARPKEITVELRKISGSLGISISVSICNYFVRAINVNGRTQPRLKCYLTILRITGLDIM